MKALQASPRLLIAIYSLFLPRGNSYQAVRFVYIWPAILFLATFFVFPLLENLYRSFLLDGAGRGVAGLGSYQRLLFDPFYLNVIFQTIALSAIVTVICILIGYPVAYYMVRHAGRWYSIIIFLLIMPLLTSIIMRTYGWRVLFARRGLLNLLLQDFGIIDQTLNLLNSPEAVVIGLVHVLVPFAALSIASVLQGIDLNLEESARILGASKLKTFLRVTLPLSLDGIGTAAILVFMIANGSFVTLLLLGGGSLQTLPLLIYQQFNTTRDFAFAAAMSNVLLVVAVFGLYLQLRLIRRKGIIG